MLTGSALCKAYGKNVVLDGVNVAVEPGRGLALLGKNGSGKSTLLSILALALRPDGGSVEVDGLPTKQARPLLGYAPQDIALFEDLTVQENLQCFCTLKGAEAAARLDEACAALMLDEFRGKRLDRLSGGQRRRVNLAAALMGSPRYLLLDEPFAGVDGESEERIAALLKAQLALGLGLIVSTHRLEPLRGVADRVMELSAGGAAFYGELSSYDKFREEARGDEPDTVVRP